MQENIQPGQNTKMDSSAKDHQIDQPLEPTNEQPGPAEDRPRPIGERRNQESNLAQVRSPEIPLRETWRSVGAHPPTEFPDPIFLVRQAAYDQIWAEARGGLHPQVREIGGMFLGQAIEDSGVMYVVAREAVPASGGIGSAGSFKFTSESIGYILNVQESNFPDLRIVGWYHSHPGYGICLSKEWDQFICDQWFSREDQFTLVIDPVSEQEGIFIRREGVLVTTDFWGYRVFDEQIEPGGMDGAST